MSLAKMFKEKLTPELWQQVQDSLGDDFTFDYVPRTRLNTVIAQRESFKTQLEELSGASSKDTDSSSGETSPSTGKAGATDADVEAKLNELKTQYEQQIASLKTRYALTDKLRESGCRNPDLLLDKFPQDKIKFDESGAIIGYEEDLTKWKTSAPYLFKANGEDVPEGTGAQQGSSTSPDESTKVDTLLGSIFGLPKSE